MNICILKKIADGLENHGMYREASEVDDLIDVYHGTAMGGFDRFDLGKAKQNPTGIHIPEEVNEETDEVLGVWFTGEEGHARFYMWDSIPRYQWPEDVLEYNPMVYTAKISRSQLKDFNEYTDFLQAIKEQGAAKFKKELMEQGYKGIKIRSERPIYCIFNPADIISVRVHTKEKTKPPLPVIESAISYGARFLPKHIEEAIKLGKDGKSYKELEEEFIDSVCKAYKLYREDKYVDDKFEEADREFRGEEISDYDAKNKMWRVKAQELSEGADIYGSCRRKNEEMLRHRFKRLYDRVLRDIRNKQSTKKMNKKEPSSIRQIR